MSKHYAEIAFTDDVATVQQRYGSAGFYARKRARATPDEQDPLTEDEIEFLAQRDGIYLATVNAKGWPYVQYRGGSPGFVHVLDNHTLAWADFRGNLQYISTGNLTADDRVALFAMDYPHRQRLKVFGRARVVYAEDEPDLIARLSSTPTDGVVERGFVVSVEAYDWNCPQHITPRYTLAELQPHIAPLRARIAALENEVDELRKGRPVT